MKTKIKLPFVSIVDNNGTIEITIKDELVWSTWSSNWHLRNVILEFTDKGLLIIGDEINYVRESTEKYLKRRYGKKYSPELKRLRFKRHRFSSYGTYSFDKEAGEKFLAENPDVARAKKFIGSGKREIYTYISDIILDKGNKPTTNILASKYVIFDNRKDAKLAKSIQDI